MKKTILLCLLGYLCFPISNTTAQVADSPGADLLHRFSGPHRGGETRPDTFPRAEHRRYHSNTSQIAVRPGSVMLSTGATGVANIEALVDDSIPTGQGSEGSSARVGEFGDPAPALIYGELINPDSLGPLKVTFSPYYLNRKSSFEEQVLEIPLKEGGFFDGVVNPWASKFLIQSPALLRPGYFTLTLDDRVLLKKYLIFPGDSLKIFVDLKDSHIVFSGPDRLTAEVQYQMKRNGIQTEFSEPRKIVMPNPNQAFSDEDLRQWELQKQAFGARLEMENPNSESLERLLDKVSENDRQTVLNETGLGRLLEKLDPIRKDLILLDFYSDYYRSPLSMLYLYYYPAIPQILEREKLDDTYARITQLLDDIPTGAFSEYSKLVSGEWLDLELDRLSLLSLISNEPFLSTLERTHHGEVAERLGTAFLDQNLRRYPEPTAVLKEYGGFIQTDPWAKKLTSLKAATVPGDKLIGLQVQNLKGETLQLETALTKPTLVYFYFSTCSHSAKYFKNLLYPFYLSKAKARGVDLIAISVDKDRNLWRSAIGEYSDASIANYLFLPQSKEEWASYYNISGYPRTFILDPGGKILSFGLSRESVKAFEGDFDKVLPSINTSMETDRP
jgi:cytochrome oxidase Cu insertion factor (SCO1/SenC/PrrC family)